LPPSLSLARRLHRVLPLLLCLAVLPSFTGCNTPDRRIRQNPELFLSLEPAEQEMVRQGQVGIGFTPEMVTLAWGRPDFRQTNRTEEAETVTWTWVNRHSVYDGRRFAGYRRDVYFDPRTNQYRSIMRPTYVTIYRTVETEAGRVDFRDGVVARIVRVD
jgi:hypothetical protein